MKHLREIIERKLAGDLPVQRSPGPILAAMRSYEQAWRMSRVNGARRMRLLCCSFLALLVWSGCGGSESTQDTGASLDSVGLLVVSPALPKTVTTTGGPEPIEWVREAGDGPVKLPTCEDGEAAFRAWSEDGIVGGIPKVTHVVCVFETEAAAADAYDSQSLPELAGENWENFEPGAEAATVPTDLDSLDMLSSDEWELGCGVGDPDIACSAWMFRARYGRVLTDVEFFSSPGEISFADMRELVKSIDLVVARGA